MTKETKKEESAAPAVETYEETMTGVFRVAHKLGAVVESFEKDGDKLVHIMGGLMEAAYFTVRHGSAIKTPEEREKLFIDCARELAQNFEQRNKLQA
jgi:hypothetical protein